jgi:uncharacterized protein (TIGR02246 family)
MSWTDDDRAAIEALRGRWVAAIKARDPDALIDLLTDDYEVWANGAPPFKGPRAAADGMRAALDRFEIEQGFEPIETVVCGDWAFERGVETIVATPREGGEPTNVTRRALLILRRGPDGNWRFARGMTNAGT